MESITIAKERGATLRVGPELEIPCVNICLYRANSRLIFAEK